MAYNSGPGEKLGDVPDTPRTRVRHSARLVTSAVCGTLATVYVPPGEIRAPLMVAAPTRSNPDTPTFRERRCFR